MKKKKISLVIIVVMMLVTISCSLPQCSNSIGSDGGNSNSSSQGNQTKISLPDGASLELDPRSLPNEVEASIELVSQEKRTYDEYSQVGSIYEISLGSEKLNDSAILTLPYDPASLPEDVDPETLFIAYYDEDVQDWQFVGGDVDTENHLITVKTDHASRWSVFTWNWDAWIAVLDNVLSLNLVSWYKAVDLLTDDCPQSGEGVWVDSTKSGNLIQGCIEQDGETEAVLKVINPKSFYYEITANSEGQGNNFSELLSPGGSYEFEIDKLSAPPVEVRAEITQKAGYRLFVHWFLSYLPGLNSAELKPQEVDCLAERLEQEGLPIVSSVIDDLIGGDTTSGVKASMSLIELWLDIDFLESFLEGAGVCIDYLPATWSLDNIRKIASSSSVIIEGWDFIMNYAASANGSPSQVSFNWTQLGPSMGMTNTPESQNADLDSIEIPGVRRNFYLTYDTNTWGSVDDGYGPYLTMMSDPDCRISGFIPFGFDPVVDIEMTQVQMGSYTVSIEQFSVDNETFLEIYHVDNEMISIAVDTGNTPEQCMGAAREVIEISAENDFSQQ